MTKVMAVGLSVTPALSPALSCTVEFACNAFYPPTFTLPVHIYFLRFPPCFLPCFRQNAGLRNLLDSRLIVLILP